MLRRALQCCRVLLFFHHPPLSFRLSWSVSTSGLNVSLMVKNLPVLDGAAVRRATSPGTNHSALGLQLLFWNNTEGNRGSDGGGDGVRCCLNRGRSRVMRCCWEEMASALQVPLLLTALLRITAAASDRCSQDQVCFCSARWTKFKQVLKATLRGPRHMRRMQTRRTFLRPCLNSASGDQRRIFLEAVTFSKVLFITEKKERKNEWKKETTTRQPNVDHTNRNRFCIFLSWFLEDYKIILRNSSSPVLLMESERS